MNGGGRWWMLVASFFERLATFGDVLVMSWGRFGDVLVLFGATLGYLWPNGRRVGESRVSGGRIVEVNW